MLKRNKIKKLHLNFLEERLSTEGTFFSKLPIAKSLSLFNIHMKEDTVTNPLFIVSYLSFVISLFIFTLDLFLFFSCITLSNTYKNKKIEVQPYQKHFSLLNKKLSLLQMKYKKLDEKLNAFKDINHIFDNYYQNYKSIYDLIHFITKNLAKENIYLQSMNIKLNSNNNISINIEENSFKNISPINKLSYQNGCYFIHNVCIKSIKEIDSIKVNKFGFKYFHRNFVLTGEIYANKNH